MLKIIHGKVSCSVGLPLCKWSKMSLLYNRRCSLLFFHFVQEYPLSEEELLALRIDEVRLRLYTSSIFRHALLKIVRNLLLQCFDDAVITFIMFRIFYCNVSMTLWSPSSCSESFIAMFQRCCDHLHHVQNLLLQCFDDAVITFIRQEKTVNNFEQCRSEYRAGVSQPLLLWPSSCTRLSYSGHIRRRRYEVWPGSWIFFFHGFFSHSQQKHYYSWVPSVVYSK